jgi:opacity protein-like surface antigen
MKKVLVGISTLLIATGMSIAADCGNCSGKKCGCKPKKYRTVYVTQNVPDTMYSEQTFADPDIGAEYRPDPYYESTRYKTNRKSWYIGGRIGADFLTWENEYKVSPAPLADGNRHANHDDYVLEPVLGGNIFAGVHFSPSFRGEIEGGYMAKFTDMDDEFTFRLSTPYVTANAYYDFVNGFYLGGGLGVAFPKGEVYNRDFDGGSASKRKTSLMGSVMLGYQYYLSESLVLDLRYRLSGFMGPEWKRNLGPAYAPADSLKIDTGFILDNSISFGLRYEF